MKQKTSSEPDSKDLSTIEAKLHSGPEAAKRFENVLKAVVSMPKAEFDKEWAKRHTRPKKPKTSKKPESA
jgi:hypothetical protein